MTWLVVGLVAFAAACFAVDARLQRREQEREQALIPGPDYDPPVMALDALPDSIVLDDQEPE